MAEQMVEQKAERLVAPRADWKVAQRADRWGEHWVADSVDWTGSMRAVT
jgi:hypothetical protein